MGMQLPQCPCPPIGAAPRLLPCSPLLQQPVPATPLSPRGCSACSRARAVLGQPRRDEPSPSPWRAPAAPRLPGRGRSGTDGISWSHLCSLPPLSRHQTSVAAGAVPRAWSFQPSFGCPACPPPCPSTCVLPPSPLTPCLLSLPVFLSVNNLPQTPSTFTITTCHILHPTTAITMVTPR